MQKAKPRKSVTKTQAYSTIGLRATRQTDLFCGKMRQQPPNKPDSPIHFRKDHVAGRIRILPPKEQLNRHQYKEQAENADNLYSSMDYQVKRLQENHNLLHPQVNNFISEPGSPIRLGSSCGISTKHNRTPSASKKKLHSCRSVSVITLPKQCRSLTIFKQHQFLLKKVEGHKTKQLQAYWKKGLKFVRLLEETPAIQKLLPIYADRVQGRVNYRRKEYIIFKKQSGLPLEDSVTKEFGAFDKKINRKAIKQLITELIRLHKGQVVFGRVHPRNVICHKSGNFTFDLAKIDDGAPSIDEKKEYYLQFPPEVWHNTRQNVKMRKQADVWGIGCLVLYMMAGASYRECQLHPYSTMSEEERESHLGEDYEKYRVECERQLREEQEAARSMCFTGIVKSTKSSDSDNSWTDKMPSFGKQFIEECLKIDYRERSTLEQLLKHRFLVFKY